MIFKKGPSYYDLTYALISGWPLKIMMEKGLMSVTVKELRHNEPSVIEFAGTTVEGAPYTATVNVNQHRENYGTGLFIEG